MTRTYVLEIGDNLQVMVFLLIVVGGFVTLVRGVRRK